MEQATVLPLATEDLKRNEWVWVVGQEMGRRGAGRTVSVQGDGVRVEAALNSSSTARNSNCRGFSGAPVVNAKGQVVGIVLGGREPTVLCLRVTSIRDRLSKKGIQTALK